MGIPKVVYYNVPDTLDYENSLLRKWGRADQIRLVEVKRPAGDDEEFVKAAADADGLVLEYTELTSALLDRLPRLRIESEQAIGVSNVDVKAATAHGVGVTNTPGFCVQEVATHVVGMLIDLEHKITYLDRTVRAGKWDPLLGRMPHRIAGRTVGLAFFGGIPRTLTPMLQGLGLKVIAWAPTKTREYLAGFGVEKAETLDDLLRRSDYVSLHTPLIAQTHHLIGARELDLMKPDAFLINTARGGVVDEAALVAALKAHRIAGAGIDVIEDEITEHTELRELENVVITPHSAFLSAESFAEARRVALEQLVQLLVEGRRPTNLVNPDVALKGVTQTAGR